MKDDSTTAYQMLEARFARHGALGEVARVLDWDTSTMMPRGGAAARAEQRAALDRVRHDMLADPAIAGLLDAAAAAGGLGEWQAANLREMRRAWTHATAVPPDLLEAHTRAAIGCEMAWREARPASDFAALLPHAEEVLALTRELGAAKAERLGGSVYEALLDQWEPGGATAPTDAVFDDLAAFLPGFTDRVLARQATQPAPERPAGPFPVAAQEALGRRLMSAFGFDFDHGRLDTSIHPFCGGVPDDIRITTRYDEADFMGAMMAVLHETGHALYERGLPPRWRRQPVGRSRGMGIHESQSLLIEMQACRGAGFFAFAAPLMGAAFGGAGAAWEGENLHRLYTHVARSLIRVEADEVTYPAHVILRYRLEKTMIAGELQLADLPGAWGDGMAELVGTRPPDDRRGCLQDIHWYAGVWGYFPTYTLGAMTAAQLFDTARRDDPDILPGIGEGDFAPLLAWLRARIHARAKPPARRRPHRRGHRPRARPGRLQAPSEGALPRMSPPRAPAALKSPRARV